MTVVLSVFVVVGGGLLAGVLFAVALSVVPAFLAMAPAEYVRVHQLVGRHFDKVMPPLVLACTAADLVLFAAAPASPYRPLFAAAAALQLGVSAVSQFGNVPINRAVKRLSPTAMPAGWRDPRPRWRAWHLTRTAMAVLAGLANVCAVVLAG
ncbi:DUF1772 domain-containing protein [Streptosporangium sandarakinum]|uniref:Putative membrane protein n=1 Tax=Streptosporangium sandarakinum TaxID=1260955 RepID=A0A852V0X3_9ACTN|nr:DUF1772 domain-containing protein [Streptosporangium sandarakinum]NYF41626.1 putative membrane protein [Streptosporangium sandarakinum]